MIDQSWTIQPSQTSHSAAASTNITAAMSQRPWMSWLSPPPGAAERRPRAPRGRRTRASRGS
jgi:hypothetical protein